jgi:hypothetical protein
MAGAEPAWIIEVLVAGTQTVLYRSRILDKAAAMREGARLQKERYDVRFHEVDASVGVKMEGR